MIITHNSKTQLSDPKVSSPEGKGAVNGENGVGQQNGASNPPPKTDFSVGLSSDDFNYNQVNSGPAAILTLALNMMAENFAKLVGVNAELTATQTETQKDMAVIGQAAQIRAGEDQANATRAQAYGEFATAATSVVSIVANQIQQSRSGFQTQANDATTKLGTLDSNMKLVNARLANPITNDEVGEAPVTGANNQTAKIAAYAENGVGLDTDTLTKEQADVMTTDQAKAVQKQMRTQIKTQQNTQQNAQSALSRMDNMWMQIVAPLARGATTGSAGVFQAYAQNKAAIDNAVSTMVQYIGGSAGALLQKALQAMMDAYNQILQVVAALRSGSQASGQ